MPFGEAEQLLLPPACMSIDLARGAWSQQAIRKNAVRSGCARDFGRIGAATAPSGMMTDENPDTKLETQ